jgi:DNA-binding PadR family transcriptional regulator
MATTDVLLALLADGPRHGYDLKRGHDTWFDRGKPLAFGQVYASLARLERDGLVAQAHTEAGSGPERTIYELTDAGRLRLDEWIGTPVDPSPPGADELVRKAVAAIRLGLDPAGFVARQRAAHLRRMHELQSEHPDGAGADAADPVSRLVREHAVAHLDADLRWLDDAAAWLARHPAGTDELTSRDGMRNPA